MHGSDRDAAGPIPDASLELLQTCNWWCIMSLASVSLHLPYSSSRHPAFSNLPPEALTELDAISALVEYPPGVILMRQGESSKFVRIVCSGRVKISTSSQEGKTLLLRIAGPGTVLDLASVIEKIAYETTAEAYGPCLVQEIPDEDFLTFLLRRRTICRQVMQMLAAENRELLVQARRMALSGTIAGNVAKLLLDWGTTMNCGNGKKQFTMVLTHQEIAEMVGTTRETVTRTLVQFRQNGWIRIHGASLEILQQEKLRSIAA